MNFNKTNTAKLDKDLSPEERAEWNAIYASYRAGSLLSGEVMGVDSYLLKEKDDNSENNENSGKMLAVVVIPFRVKILIPEKLMWTNSDNTDNIPKNVTRNLLGAKIDFVIQEIDRENNVCVASRVAATKIKRKQFFNSRPKPKAGDLVKCNVLAVGTKTILVEVNGFDLRLKRSELCHSIVSDFRLKYVTGETLPAVITHVSKADDELGVSVRDAKPHPYIGLQKRHPLNCRRTSVITGKYKGSIFCKLEDDYDCLCNYSEFQNDEDFEIGDRVIIIVKKYSDKSQRVFGVIVSKWR